MKRIQSINDLQVEKKKIAQHGELLEKKIRNNWFELRTAMKPETLGREAFRSALLHATSTAVKNNKLQKGLLAVGALLLAKRMVQRKWPRIFGK